MTIGWPATLMIAMAALSVTGSSVVEAAQPGEGVQGRLRERLLEKKAEEERPIDLQAILPGARKQTDAYGTDPAQRLDVYRPPHARDAPILVTDGNFTFVSIDENGRPQPIAKPGATMTA